MRLIDADEYKGKCICNHLYSGVTKLIEVDAVPTAFDLENVIEKLEEKVIEELGITKGQFAMDKEEYSSYCSLCLSDVVEILKSVEGRRLMKRKYKEQNR